MSTAPQRPHGDDLAQARRRRAAARTAELAALLERRPDLWGVYLPADLAAESILWSA